MRYHIGVAVNKKGKIISPFSFPSKSEYVPIDTTFSYCKLIDIARQVKKDLEPIKEVSFEFDSKTKRFYWLIIEKIKNEKEGLNYISQVMIDASALTETKLIKAKAYVDY